MSEQRIRFANGREASDHELHCVALAFGFSSWDHMRREFVARDRDRAITRAVTDAKAG
ncbi:hypothetical protein [Nocardia concava]|uniref:hypothetical protein n=1 Tax=Nocardia concava TaxID=257281 RepID=UPI0002F3BAFC|nr:hypothetical protein [Nocardia concava]